jgi:cytidylate kinase
MSSNIVAISRQFGSGGARIGRAVAERLGYSYADREILAEAARTLEVEAGDLEPMEERVRGFWERLGSMFATGAVDTPFMPPPLPTVSESELFEVERKVIEALAAHGRAVIVGRGAPHILSGRPGVIRVFLHAPLETRAALALQEYGLADEEAAAVVARSSDAQRARFARTIAGRDWCDATLYDLTLNTASIGLDKAADLIAGLMDGRSPSTRLHVTGQPNAGGNSQ